ncbi:MAG: hypothetical protein AAF388_20305, partial [Bacteroidota bacterium]
RSALESYSDFFKRAKQSKETGHGIEIWKVYQEQALLQIEFADLEKAEKSLHEAIKWIGDDHLKVTHSLKRLLKKVQASKEEEKYALLISTDSSADNIISGWHSRLSDLGFTEIRAFKGNEVDKDTLVNEFTWIAEKAIIHPSFFCFVGEGELSEKGLPETILAFQEKKEEDYGVTLSELQALSEHASHLLSVLEVDFGAKGETESLLGIEKPLLGNACFLSAAKTKKGGKPLYQRWEGNNSLSETMQAVLEREKSPEFAELVRLVSDELSVYEAS